MEIYVYNMYENYVPENETFATSFHDLVLHRMLFSHNVSNECIMRDSYARQFFSQCFHKKVTWNSYPGAVVKGLLSRRELRSSRLFRSK